MKNLLNTLFLFTALIAATYTATAQTTDTVKTKDWFHHDVAGAAQIQVTYRNYDLGQVNRVLNNNGIPSLGHNSFWYNASMMHVCNNWISEDGLGFTLPTSASTDDYRARFNQYQAYLREGYNLSKNSSFRLFPFVGVNFNASVLNIKDKTGERSTDDFSAELLNTTASKTFYQPNFGIELGAGFDYVIKLSPKQMDCFSIERSIPIGIRAGYYINAAQGDWKFDDHSLNNAPDKRQNAVFVSVNIGLGYHIRK